MTTGKNRKIREKLLSIRLGADGLTFWTTALECASGGTGSGYKAKPGSDSRELTIPFNGKLAPADNAGLAAGCVRAAADRCAGISGWAGWPVRVMPDTRKIVLVPAELFDPAQAADYLRINNMNVAPGEQIVLSHLSAAFPSAEIIMAYDKRALDEIDEVFGEYVWHTSLFDTATAYASAKRRKKDSGRCFSTLYLTPNNVYITIQSASGGQWLYYETLPYSTPTDVLYYLKELSSRFDILQTPVYVRGNGCEAVAWVLNSHFSRPVCG